MKVSSYICKRENINGMNGNIGMNIHSPLADQCGGSFDMINLESFNP